MERNLTVMNQIQVQKEKDIMKISSSGQSQQSFGAEMKVLASGKRITFDVINIPSDPLR